MGLVVDSEKGLFQVDEVKAAKCRALGIEFGPFVRTRGL